MRGVWWITKTDRFDTGVANMGEQSGTDPVRETLFRLLIDSGLLRPAPVSYQVAETANGRSFRLVPIGVVWPRSCVSYAAQDRRLERELLMAIYERKTVVDGGFHDRRPAQSPLGLPPMTDRGWIHPLEPARADSTLGNEQFRWIKRPPNG